MRCSRLHRRCVLALLAGLLAVGAPVSGWARPHAKHAARDQVMALENAWVKAQIAGDAGALEKLLSPDYLAITSNGDVLTRGQQLDRVRNRTTIIRSLELSDIRVKLIGQHAASVTCLSHLDAISEGHPLQGSFRYTHVYQKMANGTWVITNFEATRVPGGSFGNASTAGPKTASSETE